MKNNYCLLYLFLLFLLVPAYAEETFIELNLQVVNRDTPVFTRPQEHKLGNEYRLKLMKIVNSQQISLPPKTEALVLYYGEVKLGFPVQNYGVLVDFEGKEKTLWVDSDADGDFSEEKSYPIFKSDQYPGINVYFSPEPLEFQLADSVKGQTVKIPFQYDLPFLIVSREGHGDYFFLRSRTWLTGSVEDNGEELRIALVDTNDNGVYNDPEDMFFIDLNHDLNFSPDEGKALNKGVTFKLKKTRYRMDFQFLPEKIILEGKR